MEDYSNIKIETPRLVLLSAKKKHAKSILKEYLPSIAFYMNHPPPKNIIILEKRIIEREKQMKKGLLLYLTVFLKESNEFIGSFALENLLDPNPEMGGWLKKDSHRQGYGKEIIVSIKNWADHHLDYQSIIWSCAKENIASCKLIESIKGEINKSYQKKNKTGYTWDYLEYRILKNQ